MQILNKINFSSVLLLSFAFFLTSDCFYCPFLISNLNKNTGLYFKVGVKWDPTQKARVQISLLPEAVSEFLLHLSTRFCIIIGLVAVMFYSFLAVISF